MPLPVQRRGLSAAIRRAAGCLAAGVAALTNGAASARPPVPTKADAGKQIITYVGGGVRFSLAPAGVAGVWRMEVGPEGRAGARTTLRGGKVTGAGQVRAADGTSADVSNTGAITIRRPGGAVAWEGRIARLAAFGRARVPGLEISWKAPKGESIYGLGERFDSFDQAGKLVDLWIEDAPGQEGSRTYYANPLVYSTAGYALFASTNPEGAFDLNSRSDGLNRYRRAGTTATVYIATGRSLADLIAKRTAVQGAPRPIPDWAYGPWISRNSYENRAEAEEAIVGHVRRGNPVAAIVLEAWKGSSETGDFNNFSKDRWAGLPDFLALCRRYGIRVVLWQVPIIHPSSPQYAEGVAGNYFVKKQDGTVSHRREWLAGFANVDFTNPAAVKWWKDMMRDEVRMGIAGYKADDGEDIKPDDVFFDGRRGWQMHNEYSTLYNKALFELLEEEKANGLLWARSGSLGNERYPALWAGDQGASWQQLRSLVPAGLSSSISGMPHWSHDIGGYFGETTPELYIRWLQLGALSPLMQYHGVQPREPWAFGEAADEAYSLLARLRMNLKPALIALGREANWTGLPVMRPMALHDPSDARWRREDSQYMLGRDMLVAPVMEEGAAGRAVRFPAGVWHHALSPLSFRGPGEYEVPIGLTDAPLFIREGAAIPVQMAEGKSLGQWAPDDPFRTLRFEANRAVMRNLRAPLVGDPVGRTTRIRFEVGAEVGAADGLAARWHWADAPGDVREAPVRWANGTATADLTPLAGEKVVGRRQVYAIRKGSATVLRGEVDWTSPLAMSVLSTGSGGSRVAGSDGGRRTVVTTLTNRGSRPVRVSVTAEAEKGSRVEPASRAVTVPARGEVEAEWAVTLAPSHGAVGDTRVRFNASAASVRLADGSIALAYPGRWVVAGPFPAPLRMAHATRFPAELSISPGVAFEAGGKTVRWEQLPPEHLEKNGGIDFHAAFGPGNQMAAYAMTRLHSDREQPVELRFGSDDTLRVWVNGEPVHAVEAYRAAQPDQEIVKVRLREGLNTLVAKVGQDVGGWQMLFRLTGPGGAPPEGVTDGFDDAAWRSYAPDRPAAREVLRMPPPLAWRVKGPVPGVPRTDGTWTLPGDAEALATAPDGEGWKTVPPTAAPGNRMDLNALLGPSRDAVAYVATELTASRPTDLLLLGGSDDGLVVWLNGKVVHKAERPRGFSPDSDRVRLALPAGRNVLVARVSQGGGDWLVQLDPQTPLAQ